MDRRVFHSRRCLAALGFGIAGAVAIVPVQAQEMCGGAAYPFPYTDVSGVGAAFCPGIMDAYVTGVSKGTTATTFSPEETVTRVQTTTFLQRSLDQGLTRGNRRAALQLWWTPQNQYGMQTITIPPVPNFCAADGEYIWVTTDTGNSVGQVQASTGKVLGTWTGATHSGSVLAALGKVFVVGNGTPGSLSVIDPTQAPGALTSVATLPGESDGIAFDGTNLWIASYSGSVSIVSLPSWARSKRQYPSARNPKIPSSTVPTSGCRTMATTRSPWFRSAPVMWWPQSLKQPAGCSHRSQF